MKDYEFIKGVFLSFVAFMVLYMTLTVLFPPCDKRAKNAAFARYNETMRSVGLPLMGIESLEKDSPNKRYNWNIGVEAATQLQRDLKSCHCDGSGPVDIINEKIGM